MDGFTPNIYWMVFFVTLVFPGLISMHVYRLFMPAKDLTWKEVFYEASFYGTINFCLWAPVFFYVGHAPDFVNHPVWSFLWILFMVVVTPVVLPPLWIMLLKCKRVQRHLMLPYPTAWDYFFEKRKSAFVLIHRKNGEKIGGYYGNNSYATSFPREGDLYLEKAVRVDANGKFLSYIAQTNGFLINKGDYELIEFFEASN